MLGIDLDGTLLGADRAVSGANRDAIARARDAGVLVVVCTGRGLIESAGALEAIDQRDPVVVASGAMIACPTNRTTLHRFAIDPQLATRAAGVLVGFDHPVLVLKDALAVGYDYLLVTGPNDLPLDPITGWWFESMGAQVRRVRSIDDDEHPEHTIRVGVCGRGRALGTIRREVASVFGDELVVQHFKAVVAGEHAAFVGDDSWDVFELFDRRASKWAALAYLADRRGIEPGRIAAIGDEINDLSMIEHAGCGIAMGNAVEAIARVADRATRRNDEDGVAFAIDQLLAGVW